MSKPKRKRDYLFQRPDSSNWYIKLQYPDRRIEKSLNTRDRAEAEILALPMIAEHKRRLLEARPRVETRWLYQYEPGREHVGPEGARIIALDRELLYLDAEGQITSRAPNGEREFQLVGPIRRLGLNVPVAIPINPPETQRATLAVKNGDDLILETYLAHANVAGHSEREARNTWSLHKTLTENKPLRDASRDDGRKLVQHFEGLGLKSATIRKKLVWLNAACNLAIREGKLKFNPFAGIIPKRDDALIRLPLDDNDMEACMRNLGKLTESDQLLFRLLAATGLRLDEAFEISDEQTERSIRYVVVGSKTPQSRRRVPLPAAVLPHLPSAIEEPLFKDAVNNASKRLNKFLDDCGIVDRRKVIHSLRHRAQDRLRAAGCPEDIRKELLGHDKKTVSAGYGVGHPVILLRKWIDRIGC
jgi:integrase